MPQPPPPSRLPGEERAPQGLEGVEKIKAIKFRLSNAHICGLVLLAGLALGALSPSQKLTGPWAVLQSATGWSYTLAWSASFWPQVILNYARKNVNGLSFDFIALNMLGWVAYSAFNVAIYGALTCPSARAAHAPGVAATLFEAGAAEGARPSLLAPLRGVRSAAAAAAAAAMAGGGSSVFLGAGPAAAEFVALGRASSGSGSSSANVAAAAATSAACEYAVELNDVVFALHALLLTTVTVAQCCVYPRGRQRVHGATAAAVTALVCVAGAYGAAIALRWDLGPALAPWLAWVYWLYFLSYIKMGVTLVKYVPQALLNCRRRSTRGWSVLNIQLDLLGGVLSLGQQLLTCYWTGNWAPVASNPVKLGLAVITVVFDLVFLAQHYWLYPEPRRAPRPDAPALRRVKAVLRALAATPERLPFGVAEDALLCLGEAGVDVSSPQELARYADAPEELPRGTLRRLLAAYWAAGGAPGLAHGGRSTSAGGGGGGGGVVAGAAAAGAYYAWGFGGSYGGACPPAGLSGGGKRSTGGGGGGGVCAFRPLSGGGKLSAGGGAAPPPLLEPLLSVEPPEGFELASSASSGSLPEVEILVGAGGGGGGEAGDAGDGDDGLGGGAGSSSDGAAA